MTYEILRDFSVTWGLGYLFIAFLGVIIFVMRPKMKKEADEAANIPFNEDL